MSDSVQGKKILWKHELRYLSLFTQENIENIHRPYRGMHARRGMTDCIHCSSGVSAQVCKIIATRCSILNTIQTSRLDDIPHHAHACLHTRGDILRLFNWKHIQIPMFMFPCFFLAHMTSNFSFALFSKTRDRRVYVGNFLYSKRRISLCRFGLEGTPCTISYGSRNFISVD